VVVRCAETFVARNGYTQAAADADSSLWSAEGNQQGSRSEWPAQRHGTLQPRAVALCHGSHGSVLGFSVVFLARDGSGARGVNVLADLSAMGMVEGAFPLSALDQPDAPCTRLAPPADGAAATAGPGR
jgi:hypothetical protein